MPEIKFLYDKKGEVNKVYFVDAQVFYTNVQTPRPIYDDKDLAFDKARKEYSVVVAVTEEIADQWDEIFTKQPSTKLTNDKFRERYKLEEEDELPIPDAKKQFTIKVTQKELNKDGDPVTGTARPRVMIPQEIKQGKDVKKILKDATFDTLVGNGSTANVAIRAAKNKYGTFAYLEKVIVTDLVEYTGATMSEEEAELLGIDGYDDIEYADTPAGRSQHNDGDDESPDTAMADTEVDGEEEF